MNVKKLARMVVSLAARCLCCWTTASWAKVRVRIAGQSTGA